MLSICSIYRSDCVDHTTRTFTHLLATLAEVIRSSSEHTHHYTWFVELAKSFHSIQTSLVAPSEQFGVVCHGDLCWSNTMFKYASHPSGFPTALKFIDFQSSRFASLVTDILSFFFTSVSSTTRRSHLPHLLQVLLWLNRKINLITSQAYYTTFTAATELLHYSGPMFSLEQLMEEFQDKIMFGFLEGIWYLDIIYQVRFNI